MSDNTEKSNLLNDYFAQRTLLDDSSSTLPDSTNIAGPFLNNIQFTPLEVQGVLETLELGKSTGPDNVTNRVLKELSVGCVICLTLLCLKATFLIFEKKRMSHLSTKKMTPSLVSNYRPISLLSALGKVMEKNVHKHMFNFLLDRHAITCLQSGFVPGDSTVNQLADIYNTFCKALDEGKEVRVIFCYVSKAFNRVWHKGLIFKLKQSGIDTTLLQWLTSYLSNRNQRVVIPGSHSNWVNIDSGVPQGSIFRPPFVFDLH